MHREVAGYLRRVFWVRLCAPSRSPIFRETHFPRVEKPNRHRKLISLTDGNTKTDCFRHMPNREQLAPVPLTLDKSVIRIWLFRRFPVADNPVYQYLSWLNDRGSHSTLIC
jgi:hypothetical protein